MIAALGLHGSRRAETIAKASSQGTFEGRTVA